MRVARLLFTLVFAALPSLSAFAASVSTTQGQVLINRGQGYQQLDGTAEAAPGAQVVANPGGQAQVVYPDGCAVSVQPGTVYTIAQNSPCQAGVPGINGMTFAIGAAAVGIGAAIYFSQKDKSASP